MVVVYLVLYLDQVLEVDPELLVDQVLKVGLVFLVDQALKVDPELLVGLVQLGLYQDPVSLVQFLEHRLAQDYLAYLV